MKYYVYVDQTDSGIVFYVGYGNKNRTKSFIRNQKHANVAKKHGLNRTIVHETNELREAKSLECFWIDQCATFVDHPLADHLACNFTSGGEGHEISRDVRQVISKKNTGKKRTQEQKQFLRELHTGKKLSDETRAKMKGRKLSDETKQKIRQSRAKQVISPEHIESLVSSHRGKKRSPDWVEKIASKNRGKKRSELTRQRMCDAKARRRSMA